MSAPTATEPIRVGDVWKDCSAGHCRHVRILRSDGDRVEAVRADGYTYAYTRTLFLRQFKFAYSGAMDAELRAR